MTSEVRRYSSPSESRVTWEAIVSARPVLGDALYVARRLSRRSPGFCANRVWYAVLKPIVVANVGWVAERSCPFGEHMQTVADLLADKPIQHTEACRQAWMRQDWLRSSAAYDLAYDRIYNELPNCRHPSGLGCG